ncbi:MAG: hypothetical protein NVSMB10_11640 [Steroidobacteraceae bacterium]
MSELSTLGLAAPTDARAIAEMSRDLIEEGLSWSWTPARVQHSISGVDSSVVVARSGNRCSGGLPLLTAFAIMHLGDEVAHLNLLAVIPSYRRQGLGRQLIEWLTATAMAAGVFRINLELRARNRDARQFYERLGFERLGFVAGYYQGREAALRMSRPLARAG